ncbi:hypothetical protein P7K49_018629 [Saguinus oedipus]|uniref:Uncharacterized protein n=1 Tax=Saguinus oedipus TaxID=9490 RepID=A0ABQ9V5Y1_SAGOE|nr:hypothetical protein P7K49_018629 [Saguinus oedipus]
MEEMEALGSYGPIHRALSFGYELICPHQINLQDHRGLQEAEARPCPYLSKSSSWQGSVPKGLEGPRDFPYPVTRALY